MLKEISGLSYAGNNKLFCVQDEKGDVFIYDLEKKEISRRIRVGKDGDYEAVTFVEDDIYALKSNGTLYHVKNFLDQMEAIEVDKIELKVGSNCDAEGLCYDQKNNRLLVACKGKSRKRGAKKDIYAYDVKKQKFDENPIFSISSNDIQDSKNWISKERYDEQETERKSINTFNPSGIAIHPTTGSLYILSSVGNALIVISGNGELEYVMSLDQTLFKQPEGITFDAKNTVYIANEGRKGSATIQLFPFIERP